MKRYILAIMATLGLVLGGMLVTAPSAQAAFGSVQVYNVGPAGVGIVTEWNNYGYQYIIPAQRWTLPGVKGAYVGTGYCLDVFFSWDGGKTWYYKWSARGAQYVSFPGWEISWVLVNPYRC